ncbi:MAG: hypothetical protein KA793_05765 [Bacteroidales bacterium]|nr:hypothetical protein [Bacteroidales bacterium]
MRKFFLMVLPVLIPVLNVLAQEQNYGQVSGNFQADAQYYLTDTIIGASSPAEKTMLNSYANFIYTLGNFSAGFRYEGYMNTLLGYPNQGGINDGIGIPYRWATFTNQNFEITAGTFYEQFGNGLILRSYEEKQLGVDNAFDGVRIKINPYRGIQLKALAGYQRYYWEKGPGIVKGVDGDFLINEMIPSLVEKPWQISVGGSFVSKYQADDDPIYALPKNVGAGAGRMQFSLAGFNLMAEYAYKANDPSSDNGLIYRPGQAFLVNASYSRSGLGILLSTKWVDNMSFRSNRNALATDLNINQLPEITRNHTYSLTAFYPYATQPAGEFGVQGEVMYKFKRNTPLGGKYGTSVSLNYSRVMNTLQTQIDEFTPIGAKGTYGYNTDFFSIGDSLYFQDINFEFSKKWTSDLKTILIYQNIIYNYNVLRGTADHEIVYAHCAVADISYNFTSEVSLHTEMQALFTEQDKGNWGMLLFEFSIPKWFITVADNWNYGNPDPEYRTHYLMGGIGYNHSGNRIQISYGKQREGITCVGGVCRAVPASNGVMISISSTF